ncbi:hypothetical protein ACSMEV_15565 [Pseudomonas sp. MLB6B]
MDLVIYGLPLYYDTALLSDLRFLYLLRCLMDCVQFLPFISKFGDWLGPVAATVVGGYFVNVFTEKALNKKSLREAQAARMTLLESKAEVVLGGAAKAITEKNAKELDVVDPVVRLYFDQGVVDAYVSLKEALKDAYLNHVVSAGTVRVQGESQKSQLARELNRFLRAQLVE